MADLGVGVSDISPAGTVRSSYEDSKSDVLYTVLPRVPWIRRMRKRNRRRRRSKREEEE